MFVERGNDSNVTMAKLIETFELHYPMIQFFKIL